LIGAEGPPLIVNPCAASFCVICSSQNRVLPEQLVYAASLAPFLSYYALFALVLYPLSGQIHPTHLLDSLRTALPQGVPLERIGARVSVCAR